MFVTQTTERLKPKNNVAVAEKKHGQDYVLIFYLNRRSILSKRIVKKKSIIRSKNDQGRTTWFISKHQKSRINCRLSKEIRKNCLSKRTVSISAHQWIYYFSRQRSWARKNIYLCIRALLRLHQTPNSLYRDSMKESNW